MQIMNNDVPCIYCGGDTKRVQSANNGRYFGETRRCYVCKRNFEHFSSGSSSDDQRVYCSVMNCPERDHCELKGNAMKCAVYRMIVVRGVKTCE